MRKFNAEKELKKSRRKYTKKHLVFSLLGLIGLTILGISFAYYDVNESSIVINGDVKAPINITVMKGEEQVTNFPTSAEGYEFDRVECINSTTYTWDEANWQVNFNFTGNDDCVVYFRVLPYDYYLQAPVLDSKMVPVMIADNGTVTRADINAEWYNYGESKWANAVIVNNNSYLTAAAGTTIPMTAIEQMYVWIPRYQYDPASIESADHAIDVTFVDKTGTAHPAFTFGTDELSGMWVGKFEIGWQVGFSDNSSSGAYNNDIETTYIIKPNVNSAHSTNVKTMFYNIQKTSNAYSLDATTDVHMIKNPEWGAVAYLSQSKYGVCNSDGTCSAEIENNNYYNNTLAYDIVTGCGGTGTAVTNNTTGIEICPASNRWETANGIKASTTNNVTGIYDMAGGRLEYVMGNMQDSSGNFYPGSSGFTTAPDSKYYDSYANGSSSTDYTRGLPGDATIELNPSGTYMSNWNTDTARFVYSDYPWFARGGHASGGLTSGVWNFYGIYGNASSSVSARSVVSFEQ